MTNQYKPDDFKDIDAELKNLKPVRQQKFTAYEVPVYFESTHYLQLHNSC